MRCKKYEGGKGVAFAKEVVSNETGQGVSSPHECVEPPQKETEADRDTDDGAFFARNGHCSTSVSSCRAPEVVTFRWPFPAVWISSLFLKSELLHHYA